MHGKGNFFDPRLDDADAVSGRGARTASATCRSTRRRPASRRKLAGLHVYQLALAAPTPPAGSFDAAAAAARRARSSAARRKCATLPRAAARSPSRAGTCTPPRRSASTTSRRSRSPDKRYRTTPLARLCTHTKGGFYHDGRFATLVDVVDHYDTTFMRSASRRAEKSDLVEYLKSL